MRITTRSELMDLLREHHHRDNPYYFNAYNAVTGEIDRDTRVPCNDMLGVLCMYDGMAMANASHSRFIGVDSEELSAIKVHDLYAEYHIRLSRVTEDRPHDAAAYMEVYESVLSRYPDEALWLVRENIRFILYYYKRPAFVEALRSLRLYLKPDLWWHFPHVSVNDPQLIAYTQTRDKGQRDIQTTMKVGRYLQQFYADKLSEAQIRMMANGVKPLELRWATNASDMEDVYRNGPQSCMSDSFSDLYCHPCHVYDYHGQWRLGYLVDKLTDRIVARGLVNEPSKTWVRVYGDEANTLADMIEAEGYTKASGWYGCRVAHIEDEEGRVIMPYIDGESRYAEVKHDSSGDMYVYLSESGDAYCNRTDGYMEDPCNGGVCDACGERTDQDADDMVYSSYHGMSIGECCINSYNFAHTGNGEQDYIHESDCIYCEDDGEYYHDQYADRVLGYDENDGNYYLLENMVRDVDGDLMHEDRAIEIGGEHYNRECLATVREFIVALDSWHAKRRGMEVIVSIDDFDATDEPFIVDDFGNLIYTNWRTVDDYARLSDGTREGMRQAIWAFNNISGFYVSSWDVCNAHGIYN